MKLKSRRLALVAAFPLVLIAALAAIWAYTRRAERDAAARVSAFIVPPYVQWGPDPAPRPPALSLLWHAEDRDATWEVTYRVSRDAEWRSTAPPTHRRVAVPEIAPHRVYRARLTGLEPGATGSYRVSRDGLVAFTAELHTPPGPGRPQRFAVLGDCGADTTAERQIAAQMARAQPDYVVITGDIVYQRGRISEYRRKFFPVYNADAALPGGSGGVPLMRARPFIAAPGNHDILNADLDRYPDGLAYFLYWDQPLNGPPPPNRTGRSALSGPTATLDAFRAAAGPAYPIMGSFSLDVGDVHWTVLDANPYVDFTDPALRDWIARDLAAAADRPWRFVALHHPPFNSSRSHFDDQRTRLLAPLFEAGGVAIVFAGHVHNYQRSLPLRFAPRPGPDDRPADDRGRVDGTWTLDRSFDGLDDTTPEGVIYLVTGAGGARLYDAAQQSDPETWQPFTTRFHSTSHSFTLVEAEPTRLTVRQLSDGGTELDRFALTRPATAPIAD